MRKVYAALMPGGRAAIGEFIPNPDRLTATGAAASSMMMLTARPTGDARTFAEPESIMESGGFPRIELASPVIGVNRLVIAYR